MRKLIVTAVLAAACLGNQAFGQETVEPRDEIFLVCNGSVSETIGSGSPKYGNQFSIKISIWNDEVFIIEAKYLGDTYQILAEELKDESLLSKEMTPHRFYVSKMRGIRMDWLEKKYPNQLHGVVTEKIEIDRRTGGAQFEITKNSNIIGIYIKTVGSGNCSPASQVPKF